MFIHTLQSEGGKRIHTLSHLPHRNPRPYNSINNFNNYTPIFKASCALFVGEKILCIARGQKAHQSRRARSTPIILVIIFICNYILYIPYIWCIQRNCCSALLPLLCCFCCSVLCCCCALCCCCSALLS